MAISGLGGLCKKYRNLEEWDESELVTRDDIQLEKIASSHKPRVCGRTVLLGCAVTILALTVILYVVFSPRELSNTPLLHLYSTKQSIHVLYELFQDNTKKLNHNLQWSPQPEVEKVVSCYYNTPDWDNKNQLFPSDINPHLCTHINVAFSSITNKEISIDDSLNKTLIEIVKLKEQNSRLKILLSIGGAGNNNGFSDIVVDHASRKIFIKSIKSVLRNYTLDGVDLDWEFPALHQHRGTPGGRERQHFSQLLREIRMEYIREKKDYILSVATASPETIVNVAYDVDQINIYVDYVNLMTYDFHYYSKYTPFTGLNSPLYPRVSESLYLATLNINYTVNMYMSKGLDRNKIVLGIPTYGHTFTLVNVENGNVGSPAAGIGTLGAGGYVSFPEVCAYLHRYNGSADVRLEAAARVPYLHRGAQWVSYEDPRSVAEKAAYARQHGLRGAMLYSLNTDDYGGTCGGGGARFALARSVRGALLAKRRRSPGAAEPRT